jgi:hypothetical protein
MLSWIIQISIISIIFIFLVHHLLCFFKSTLTVPKIKDLVNSPAKKYQHIFDTISNNPNTNYSTPTNDDTNQNTNGYTELDLLPSDTEINTAKNANSMKDELKHFLKKQMNDSKDDMLDTMPGNTNYASFY